jgi:hypothetical protein
VQSSIYRQSPKTKMRSKKCIESNSRKNPRRNSIQSPVMIENEITSNIEETELKTQIQKRGLRFVYYFK